MTGSKQQAEGQNLAEVPPASSPLSIHDMTVAYYRRPVLWDVDYAAPAGKLIAILGPNGAGKSTLISAVLHLVPKASGSVAIFGKPYRAQVPRVLIVKQIGGVDRGFCRMLFTSFTMGLYGKI